MRHPLWTITTTLLVLMLVGSAFADGRNSETTSEFSQFATLSKGPKSCDVGITSSGPDIPIVGPRAIAVGPDGSIAIADAAGGRIIRLGRDGTCLPPLLSGGLPVDVAIDPAGNVAVLDCRARTVTLTGKAARTWTLAPGANCDSLALDANANPIAVFDQTGHALTGDASFKMGIPDRHAPLHHFVRMTREGGAVLISSPWGHDASAANEVSRAWIKAPAGETLLAVSFIGTDRADKRYVVLDTRNPADPTGRKILRSIQVFETSGRLVAQTTIPPAIGKVRPRQALAVDPAGGVIVMNNREDGATLWRWSGPRVGGTR